MLYTTGLQERPTAEKPSLHVKLQELLNQPWEVKVALGMRVQLVQPPMLALAQPSLYAPWPHVVHSATLQELLKAPCVVK